jgi:hypothetical protein
MRIARSFPVLGVAALLFAVGVRADTVQYTSNTIADQATNWGPLNLNVSKWDPGLFPGAYLTKVTITYHGGVSGTVRYENENDTPTTVTGTLTADETLYDPNSVLLLTVSPTASRSDDLPEYDLIEDFAGTSGRTYHGATGSASGTWSSDSPLYLALFTGSGDITLTTYAKGKSFASGGGNVVSQFLTDAGAYLTVDYEYLPEPGTMALVGLGLAGIGFWRKRRSSK